MVKKFLSKMKFRYECSKYNVCPTHKILLKRYLGHPDYYCDECEAAATAMKLSREQKLELERIEFLERINS